MAIKNKTSKFPAFFRPIRSIPVNGVNNEQGTSHQSLAAIYLLRLALGKRQELSRHSLQEFFEDNLGKLTGLADADNFENELDRARLTELFSLDEDGMSSPNLRAGKAELLKYIRQRLDSLLKEGCDTTEPLLENLNLLGKTLKLTQAEQEILLLRLLMPLIEAYRINVIEHCNNCTVQTMIRDLRIMTTRPAHEIKSALQSGGQLVQMGWLKVQSGLLDLEDKINLADGLLEILMREHKNEVELFGNFFKASPATQLVLDDYSHLQNDLDVLLPYLRTALKERRAGVNVLIYGPPGAGKTQFAKLLAQTLNTPFYEVLCADQEGNVLRGNARFAACTLSQKLLSTSRKPCLLLFDEAEDVFPRKLGFFFEEGSDGQQGNSDGNKAWINQQLENNPVPMLWITNRTDNIDKAFLRRFMYSVEIDKMSTPIRRRIIDKYSKGLQVSAEWQENLVSHIDLTPAQIEQAFSIAKTIQQEQPAQSEQIAERVLEASIRLLKQKRSVQKPPSWTRYDRTFTNVDIDMESLITGLKQNQRGNFCFYGAPGTGKTALARHIAEVLGVQLHIKRASDLIDMYLGESEKNIAKMFAEAQKQNAILLLDEADSLLGERNNAHQHWEITQVNEMLTHMESFTGIFICTTNLMDKLDAASLRRFDFKVKFDFLRPEQRWDLFKQESNRLGGLLPSDIGALAVLEQQLHRLTKLTPGDFAVVSRQVSVLGKTPYPEEIIAILVQECKAKGEVFSKIGFVY